MQSNLDCNKEIQPQVQDLIVEEHIISSAFQTYIIVRCITVHKHNISQVCSVPSPR